MKTRPRVLLLVPPGPAIYVRDNYCSFSSKADYYWPPIDLVTQSGILGEVADLSVVDATAERLTPAAALERCAAPRPDLTLFVTGTASVDNDMAFVRDLKQITGTKLFGSGGNLTFWADRMMAEYPHLDGIVLEFISTSLVEILSGNGSGIEGVVLRNDGSVVHHPARRKKNFRCGIPRHSAFPLNRYKVPQARHRPFVRTLTSFGCSYRCDFCIESAFPIAYRDLDELSSEFRALSEMGIREIYFMDNVLTAWRARFLEICDELQKAGGFSWFGQSRADNLDEEVVSAARRAGCHFMMVGVESGSERILQQHKKGHGIRETIQAFELLRRHRIESLAYFILGLPGETRETMQESLDLALRLPCDYVSFTIATPDPGTAMRDAAIAAGDLADSEMRFDCSVGSPLRAKGLSEAELHAFLRTAHRRFYLRPGQIARQIASIRSPRDFVSRFATALSLLF